MAIFPNLLIESVVQVGDKTRLDARKTFISLGESAITLVRIKPEAAGSFVDVTSQKYLDWQYSTAGTKVVSVEVTTNGSPVVVTKNLISISEVDDHLFSGDAELVDHEPSIMGYVKEGRNSFLNVHRAAQDRIVTWLDEQRIWDDQGNRLTKNAIADVQEANDWSKYLVLQLTFEGISNATDDIFHEKSLRYKALAEAARNRASIRLDLDGDSETEDYKVDIRSYYIGRG